MQQLCHVGTESDALCQCAYRSHASPPVDGVQPVQLAARPLHLVRRLDGLIIGSSQLARCKPEHPHSPTRSGKKTSAGVHQSYWPVSPADGHDATMHSTAERVYSCTPVGGEDDELAAVAADVQREGYGLGLGQGVQVRVQLGPERRPVRREAEAGGRPVLDVPCAQQIIVASGI